MKKKLEAELISIAHRILKLKNKSELVQLHQETQKLYEKLTVLRFIDEHFSEVKPTIGQAEVEEKVEAAFEKEMHDVIEEVPAVILEEKIEMAPEVIEEEQMEVVSEVAEEVIEEEIEAVAETIEAETAEQEIIEEETVAATSEEVVEDATPIAEEKSDFEPHFELFKEEIVFEPAEIKKEVKQVSFDEFLGGSHSDPIFERVEDTKKAKEFKAVETEVLDVIENTSTLKTKVVVDKMESKSTSMNDNFNKNIAFGLNDKIAFQKQLFGGSSEDLNRVISQLSTYDTFQEAQDFIEDMVKPDYNNWEGKEDYVARFMEIVEKKFA